MRCKIKYVTKSCDYAGYCKSPGSSCAYSICEIAHGYDGEIISYELNLDGRYLKLQLNKRKTLELSFDTMRASDYSELSQEEIGCPCRSAYIELLEIDGSVINII